MKLVKLYICTCTSLDLLCGKSLFYHVGRTVYYARIIDMYSSMYDSYVEWHSDVVDSE